MKYGFGSKRHYRRNIYALVDRELVAVPVRERRVFCLETSGKDGDRGFHEVRFLVDRGYLPRNIYAVSQDWDSAPMRATVTRQLRAEGLADVHVKGCDALQAAIEWTDEGIDFNVLNLDFTANLDSKLRGEIEDFRNIIFRPGMVVATTILRGRESDDLVRATAAAHRLQIARAKNLIRLGVEEDAPMDYARVELLFQSFMGFIEDTRIGCHFHCDPASSRFDQYLSTSAQRMLWAASRLIPHMSGYTNGLRDRWPPPGVALAGYARAYIPPCWVAVALAKRRGIQIKEPVDLDADYGVTFQFPVSVVASPEQFQDALISYLPPRRRPGTP